MFWILWSSLRISTDFLDFDLVGLVNTALNEVGKGQFSFNSNVAGHKIVHQSTYSSSFRINLMCIYQSARSMKNNHEELKCILEK